MRFLHGSRLTPGTTSRASQLRGGERHVARTLCLGHLVLSLASWERRGRLGTIRCRSWVFPRTFCSFFKRNSSPPLLRLWREQFCFFFVITLPETNSSPLKISLPKRKWVFQRSICRCELFFIFGEGVHISKISWCFTIVENPGCNEKEQQPVTCDTPHGWWWKTCGIKFCGWTPWSLASEIYHPKKARIVFQVSFFQGYTRWWFQTFFIFTTIWGRFPFWLIFFRWVETTNQYI